MPDTLVTLDEGTDAGEFLYQQLWHVRDKEVCEALKSVVIKQNPTPEEFAAAAGYANHGEVYSDILSGLNDYGMEFESMCRNGDMEADVLALAERGLRSAERFVRAAQEIG